jgi:hypothetical protein
VDLNKPNLLIFGETLRLKKHCNRGICETNSTLGANLKHLEKKKEMPVPGGSPINYF